MSKIIKLNYADYSVPADIIDNLASEFFGKVLTNLEDSIIEVEFSDKHEDYAEIFKKTLDELYPVT